MVKGAPSKLCQEPTCTMYICSTEKPRVFNALVSMASDRSSHQMEMLRLSSRVVSLLQSRCFSDSETRRTLADLLLIGLSKNGKYISAVAPSYRQ